MTARLRVALDPNLALPDGLSRAAAENAAVRFATLDIVDMDRPDPFRLRAPIPRTPAVSYRGGLDYRGRATHVWRFMLDPDFRHSTHHLVGVQAKQHSYFAAYVAMHAVSDDEDTHLGGWIAADWRAYSERERILEIYRRRLREKPQDAARHYELALVGVALGTCFLTLSQTYGLYYPGALDEFVPIAHAAIERAPRQPRYLALAAFLHERLTEFEQAARLYGAAAAADAKSALYAVLHADALLFADDAAGATRAAQEAERRLRARRSRYRFGRHRKPLLDDFTISLAEDAQAVREKVEGLRRVSEKALAETARREIRIDRKKVPAAFRDLIPLAKQWGVGDDGLRGYFTDRASAKDKATLRKALPAQRRGELQDWLDSLGPGGITSDEWGAFTYLLEALEELGL
jgi:tetratricopeptide (TPR) repeat protein